MQQGTLLYGGRSQARIVALMLARQGVRTSHIFDATLQRLAFDTDAVFSNTPDELARALETCTDFVVCIGGYHGAQRAALSDVLRTRFGLTPRSVIAPDARIDASASIGQGVQIMPGVFVGVDTVIGDYTLLNSVSSVDHEGRIGRGVHIMGAAALAGRVTVREHAGIGTNATILPDVTLGTGSQIGAATLVRQDVPEHAVMVGCPARQLRTEVPVIDTSILDAISP
jgi:sugar O-acyltransferase (sialic acid O-acetyltransferase NeuD family)